MYVKEDNFFPVTVMILGTYHIFSSIFELNSVNDESVIVAVITFHEFNGLPKLLIIVEPR